MRLTLVHPGAAARGPLGDAAAEYIKRLKRRFEVREAFLRASREQVVARALADEAERIRARVGPRERLVALDRSTPPWSSERVAERLDRWMQSGAQGVCFALGGPHGLARELVDEADERWSFGPMTLPHDLARVVVWEQLYRAATILRGEPYHK